MVFLFRPPFSLMNQRFVVLIPDIIDMSAVGGIRLLAGDGTGLKKERSFFLGTDANLKEQNHTEYDHEDNHNDRIHKGLCQPWFSL